MAAPQTLRPGHIIRARGESWVVHRLVAGTHGSVLEVLGRSGSNRGTRTSFLLPYEPIERLTSSTTPRIVRPRTWRVVARSLLAAATPAFEALRSPAAAAVVVLPFQLEPALAIVRGDSTRVLIADEVGLGKTIQAGLIISEVLERRPEARVLVVTPAGLREQWQTELRERFARDATLLDSGSMHRHGMQWNGNPWSIPGIILASLDYVKRPEVARALESLIWDVVVFDEAHVLAGRSDRATVASILGRRARTLILLTATPHSGDEDAFIRLTSLGDFSRPPSPDASARHAFPLLAFRRTRLDIGLPSARRTVSLRVRLTRSEVEMHETLMAYARLVWAQPSATTQGARLAMMVLTRRACSSASSLARSVEARLRLLPITEAPDPLQVPLPFDDPSADDDAPGVELSSPGLADRYEERRWLEHLLQLARLAEQSESKFRALRRLLDRSREPAIVFTEYRDTLDRLAHTLRDFAIAQLHGGLSGAERRDVLRRFVGGEVRVLLATDAASEGLNLHHRCRLVINLELPWTPVRLEQRVGRVERLGQQRRVHAVHLLAANTCEEASVARLLTRMRQVAGALGDMRATACEQQIATVAIGQEPEALAATPAALPAGVIVGDLRSTATEEAARIEQVRRLGANAPQESFEHRPCVTVLRTRRGNPFNDWIYRLVFEDPELRPIWTTLLGVREEGRLLRVSNESIRQHANAISRAAEPALTAVADDLLSASSTFRLSRSRAIERERAIAEALRQQRARLATSLLQPGLFDRRAERAASAQNATLDEALDCCARRLAELARCEQVSIDRRLVFGLVRR